ncbi:MAG: hypothetical protein ABJN35_05885 [Erythrobacter sp.]
MVHAYLADTIVTIGAFSAIDTIGYVVLSFCMGIGVYAAFIFPATRRLMRDRVNLARPKVIVWIGVSIAETIFLISMVGALFAISFAAVPNFLATEQVSALESAFEVLVSPLLMGLYVWKIALICGTSRHTLRAVNRFVWNERLIVIVAYFLIILAGGVVMFGIDSVSQELEPIITQIAYAARSGVITMLVGLLVLAAYVDFTQNEYSIESVFD